ncbi:MAG TPA: transaldolase family protein [Acidimicrobiia bacterium]|nr:transaldolase family protein [Acidimicrobiia bacterium]
MKFFLDSAMTDEIQYALDMWNIDGVTTNPRHVLVSGKPFLKVVTEIAEIFAGTDKPISVEVNPHLDDWTEMVKEGKQLAAMSPNFVIKLPATEAGFKAVFELAADGIKSNLTLVFSPAQALQAMRMGAAFVSPFIGWKEANGEEVTHFIDEVTTIRNTYGFETEIIVAAARDARQIVNSAVSGADIVTAGMAVFKDAFDHPYTDVGLGKFQGFWDETTYE